MKGFIIIFVLMALISTPAAAIPTVTLTQHIGYFFPGGGEITINPSSEITWVLNYYGSKAKIGNSFQTFCTEIGEDFATLNPYNAKITDKSVSGGLVTGADPLSIGTAWLYNEFQNGSLAYYDYTTGSGRIFSANKLQYTIWWLESEMDTDPDNAISNMVVSKFGSVEAAMADNNGFYPVAVLHLTTINGGPVQDMLVSIPAPGAFLLGSIGLGIIVWLKKKKTL